MRPPLPVLGSYVEERRPDDSSAEPRRGYVVRHLILDEPGLGPQLTLLRWTRHGGQLHAKFATIAAEDMDPTTGEEPTRQAFGTFALELCAWLGQAITGGRRPTMADRTWAGGLEWLQLANIMAMRSRH